MSNTATNTPSRILNPVSLAETYPWQFGEDTPPIVIDFFNTIGVIDVLSDGGFEQNLRQRYGLEAAEYLETVKETEIPDRCAASVKTGNLDLALAVRSQFDGSRYEAYFSWLAGAGLPQPQRVLDVGCDIGITTCFYAVLYPEAVITGIDSSAAAIGCAKQLAERLQLKNVRFIVADVLHRPDDLRGQKFDLVCSTFGATDILSWWPDLGCTVEDLLAGESWEQTEFCEDGRQYARALADLLADDQSTLVSFEDMFDPHQLAIWLWALREAGIHVPSSNADLLEFRNTECDCFRGAPVLIGSRQAAEPLTAEEIRSLWTGGLNVIPNREFYEDIEAESVLMAMAPKRLCHRISTGSFELDNEACTTFWTTDSHVLIYKATDFDRKLVRLPAEDPERVIELLKDVLDDVSEGT